MYDMHYLYNERIRARELRREARRQSLATRLVAVERAERKAVEAAERASRLRASLH